MEKKSLILVIEMIIIKEINNKSVMMVSMKMEIDYKKETLIQKKENQCLNYYVTVELMIRIKMQRMWMWANLKKLKY